MSGGDRRDTGVCEPGGGLLPAVPGELRGVHQRGRLPDQRAAQRRRRGTAARHADHRRLRRGERADGDADRGWGDRPAAGRDHYTQRHDARRGACRDPGGRAGPGGQPPADRGARRPGVLADFDAGRRGRGRGARRLGPAVDDGAGQLPVHRRGVADTLQRPRPDWLQDLYRLIEIEQLRTIAGSFRRGIAAAEAEALAMDEASGLRFLIHELPTRPIVRPGEVYLALVIGGSNWQAANVRWTPERDDPFQWLDANGAAHPSPDFSQRQPFDLFAGEQHTLDFICQCIEAYDTGSLNTVAINFAFVLHPVFTGERLQGVLLGGTKEHDFGSLIGKNVGAAIEEHYTRRNPDRQIAVTLANDTVCLTLAGRPQRQPGEALSGGIVGTGINFAVFTSERHVANLEAGNFRAFPMSEAGRAAADASAIPEGYHFEKEIAGAYLHDLFNRHIAQNRLWPVESTRQMGQVIEIGLFLLERSAALAACAVAGITLYRHSNMAFVMEGGLFEKATQYCPTMEAYIDALLKDSGCRARLFMEPHSSLKGAA